MTTAKHGELSFGTIRNNTALKQDGITLLATKSFGTIRNNTALKLFEIFAVLVPSFGTIRNNTALKHAEYNARWWAVLEPFETTQL